MSKKTKDLNKYTVFIILSGAMIAATISFFTMRPDLFWICTLILIFSATSIITKGNKITTSMAIAALPLYLILIITTIPIEISLSGTIRTTGDSIASILFHFINFALILVVIVKYWRNSIPILVLFTAIFYTFYIPAFIIAVKEEHGLLEPYHALFIKDVLIFIPFNILTSLLIAFIISKKKNVPFLKLT